jgi:hypothetical protein
VLCIPAFLIQFYSLAQCAVPLGAGGTFKLRVVHHSMNTEVKEGSRCHGRRH